MRKGLVAVALLAALAGGAGVAGAAFAVGGFKDPLDVAAAENAIAVRSQLTAVAVAGKRLVAVGARGLIVLSDDQGRRWRQAAAPAGSDLTDVQFPTARDGWAVGHDGVVLHSADGGQSWTKQFDGRMARDLLLTQHRQRAAAGDPVSARLLPDIELNYANGPEQALLGVWFEDKDNGFVVGSFGTILATADGGRSWESWMDRIDADGLVHLNAVRRIGGHIFVASEQGTVFRLDPAQRRFVARPTGYGGSFFSIAGKGDAVIAFGLLGNAYRSGDGGESWTRAETGVGGSFTNATTLEDGTILAVTRNGGLVATGDTGRSFRTLRVDRPMLLTGVAAVGDSLVLTGLGGVQGQSLKQ